MSEESKDKMHTAGIEQRDLNDRRLSPTPMISKFSLYGGRRRTIRRQPDRKKHLFVDLYSNRLFLIVVTLTILSSLDAFMTLVLIEKGIVREANPVMAYFLDFGIMPFTLFKLIVTGAALLILCIAKNAPITRISLPVAVKIYVAVIAYEFYLYLI